MQPGRLWQISFAPEFSRGMPQVYAPDSRLINVLDEVKLIKWDDLQSRKVREPQVMLEFRAHFQYNTIKQNYSGKTKLAKYR